MKGIGAGRNTHHDILHTRISAAMACLFVALARTRDNLCNDQRTSAVGQNNRRFIVHGTTRSPFRRHLPAIIIAWIIVSFLLSKITTTRPLFVSLFPGTGRPAVPGPRALVIVAIPVIRRSSARVNTVNTATASDERLETFKRFGRNVVRRVFKRTSSERT